MVSQMKRGLNDLPDARIIRDAVFCREQGFQDEYDEIDAEAFHIVLYIDENPVATGRMYEKKSGQATYILGRIAVLKTFRKRRLGEAVMLRLEEKAKELGGKRAELSAQIQASGFYERLGYRKTGEVYLDEGCPHIKMVKELE